MDRHPTVTVVTATYNLIKAGRDRNIVQCIESVHSQDYPSIEHLVIDGASTDGTLDLLRPYEKKGWLRIFSEPDKGIYDAMNKGVAKSTGEFIAFLNSDDFWHDHRGVSASVEALERENADFSFAPVCYLKEQDVREGVLRDVIGSFHTRMPCCHQSMFVRRRVFDRIGSFDTKYRSSADFDFILRMCLAGFDFVRVPLYFTSFRHTGLSAGTGASLGDKECIDSLQRNLSKLAPYGFETARRHFNDFIMPEEVYLAIRKQVSPKLRAAMDKEKPEKMDGGLLRVRRVPYIDKSSAKPQKKKKPTLVDRIYGAKFFGIPLFGARKTKERTDVLFLGRIPVLRVEYPDPSAVREPLPVRLRRWAVLHCPWACHPDALELARLGGNAEPVPTLPICFLGDDFSIRRICTTPEAFRARSSRFVVSETARRRLDKAFKAAGNGLCFVDFRPEELTYHTYRHEGTAPLEFSRMPFLKNAIGFSFPEPWGCWTDGPDVRFAFRTDIAGRDLRIRFKVIPALYDCHPALDAKVRVNGQAWTLWRFSRDQSPDTTLLVPAKRVPPSGRLAFEFRIDNPRSPAFWGVSPDSRRLGLALSSVQVEPLP